MIEINFLEIKKMNMVPIFLVLISMFLLSSIAGILYWQEDTYQNEVNVKQQILAENQDVEVEIVDYQQIQKERLALLEQINGVKDIVVPSVALRDKIISLLPVDSILTNFSYDYQNGIILDVQIDALNKVATYTSTMDVQPYVANIIVHNISRLVEDASYYNVSIEMTIDHDIWKMEALNNENQME